VCLDLDRRATTKAEIAELATNKRLHERVPSESDSCLCNSRPTPRSSSICTRQSTNNNITFCLDSLIINPFKDVFFRIICKCIGFITCIIISKSILFDIKLLKIYNDRKEHYFTLYRVGHFNLRTEISQNP